MRNLTVGYLVPTEAEAEMGQLIKRWSPAIYVALCKILQGVKMYEFLPSRTSCWEHQSSFCGIWIVYNLLPNYVV